MEIKKTMKYLKMDFKLYSISFKHKIHFTLLLSSIADITYSNILKSVVPLITVITRVFFFMKVRHRV